MSDPKNGSEILKWLRFAVGLSRDNRATPPGFIGDFFLSLFVRNFFTHARTIFWEITCCLTDCNMS